MTLTKKALTLRKTKSFMEHYPILLCFQHNNLNLGEWCQLRSRIQEIPNVHLLFLQNKITTLFLKKQAPHFGVHSIGFRQQESTVSHFLQGPCFFLGCFDINTVEFLESVLKSSGRVVFLGGLYHGTLLSHANFQKLKTLDTSVYHDFLETVDLGAPVHTLLMTHLGLNLLAHPLTVLIHSLEFLSSVKASSM